MAEQLLNEAQQIPGLAGNEIWWQLASELALLQNNQEVALQIMQKAVEAFPENTGLRYRLQDLQLRLGRFEPVLQYTQSVLDRQDVSTPWWVYMQHGSALAGTGDKQNARRAFESAIAAVEQAPADVFFDSPRQERTQLFLSKIL